MSGTVAQAAVHHVRQGASGQNNGSDWANAFTALPATLVRGDTYLIAAGEYGGYTFNTPLDGTRAIVIKKATASDHGTDTGWQPAYGDAPARFGGPWVFATGQVVLDGQTGGGPLAWDSGFGFVIYPQGIVISPGVSHLEFRHLKLHRYPDRTPRDQKVLPVGHGVHMLSVSDVLFSHCMISDLFGCQFLWRNCSRITLEYSHFARNKSTPEWHAEAISDADSDQVILRHNLWEDIDGTAFIAGLNGVEGDEEEDWEIYGNVFSHTGWDRFSVSAVITVIYDASNRMRARNWKIYHNDFINIKGRACLPIDSPSQTVEVRNNYWYGNRADDAYVNYVFIAAGGSYDYNHYNACVFPWSFQPAAHEPGKIPNTIVSSLNFDPFVDWRSRNFQLQEASPSGEALPAPYNQDMLGNIRGADGTWDRGAVEHLASGPWLTLTSPNGSEIWRRGELHAITWMMLGAYDHTPLQIELLQNGNVVGIIASGVAATLGTYPWTVGQMASGICPPGNTLKIRIRFAAGAILAEKEIH